MLISDLLKISDNQRDQKWEDQFLTAFTQSNIQLLTEEPQMGPDSWPYMIVQTSQTSDESAQKLLQWVSTRGIGIVINPHKTFPDFVLTYGMIWHFRETGYFIRRNLTKNINSTESSVQLDLSQANFADPTPEILPDYARKILKEFFIQQNILRPKISTAFWHDNNFDLVISLESIGNPPEADHPDIAEALSWFLPPHYSILFLSEKQLPYFWEI
jgi:hypothetical protein